MIFSEFAAKLGLGESFVLKSKINQTVIALPIYLLLWVQRVSANPIYASAASLVAWYALFSAQTAQMAESAPVVCDSQ